MYIYINVSLCIYHITLAETLVFSELRNAIDDICSTHTSSISLDIFIDHVIVAIIQIRYQNTGFSSLLRFGKTILTRLVDPHGS